MAFNQIKDGVLEVAIAGTKPLQGTGKLLDVQFEPIIKKLRTTSLQLQEGNMNDESIVIKSLTLNKNNNQMINTKVRWKAEALGEDLTYSWVLYEGSKSIERKGYSKVNYFETTLKKAGTYRVLLMVKDINGEVVSKVSEDLIALNGK
ncbi:hypothetical protein [Bacillus sp. T3]|uniref:hypothetical protein n=1 Tax=Bacillus sp. T3 TaxID=467262 RepID=UPI00298101CF|nr:hypothetical protein [Bacillus sp. T3]